MKGKLIGLTVISVGVVLFLNYVGAIDYSVVVPLIGRGFKLNGMIYFILMVGLLVFSTNSMNITDGLDGLALGISIIVLAFIVLVAYQKVNLEVMHGGLILLGTCLGALIYNKFPAKIFIGDTGSLFLGGAIAIFLIKLQMPLWIPIVLIVCLWESFTVVIQLFSLRLRGKKVFKIEPYHHHLEKSGWEETKIVYWFWLITGLFCTIGYLAL